MLTRMDRPRPIIRVCVLVAAIACLGLTMCHAEKTATTPQNVQPPAPTPQAQQPANPPPTYFPATKAAGPIR